jgi:hypothetical protein
MIILLTAEWVEGIPPDRKTVLRSRPGPSLPEVNGLDSCPMALAAVAAIKTFQQTKRPRINKEKKKQKRKPPNRRQVATNLVPRELRDLPRAKMEGGRSRDSTAARRVPGRGPGGGKRKGGGGGRGRRAARGAGRGEARLGHGRAGLACGALTHCVLCPAPLQSRTKRLVDSRKCRYTRTRHEHDVVYKF